MVTGVSRQTRVSAGGVCGLEYRVVWCPRCRHSVLADRVVRRCEELILARADGPGWPIVALKIMPGQVFVEVHRSDSPSLVASQFNGLTSRRLRGGFLHLRSRLPALWSRSYVAAAVDAASTQRLRRYSGGQDERRWRKERTR